VPEDNQSIYFEVQTGIIRTERPAISDFYQFRILAVHRGFLEISVKHAAVHGKQLMFDLSFYHLLDAWEREAEKARGGSDA
jgi:hypothetical protein